MQSPVWVNQAKELMQQKGIKQVDLLDIFDVESRGGVGHYFSGRQIINVEQLERLSQKLGVALDYLDEETKRKLSNNASIAIDQNELRTSLTDIVFKLIQIQAINLSAETKISSIADIIANELTEHFKLNTPENKVTHKVG